MRTVRGAMASRGALIEQAELRHPFGHKFVEGKGDIAGGDRAAVVKRARGLSAISIHEKSSA
jgi:hypothetical protein